MQVNPLDSHADLCGKMLKNHTNFLLKPILSENIAELRVHNFNNDLLDIGGRQAVRKHV